MNFLTADESMLARLRGIVEPVEIRDPDGNVLGQYTPIVSSEKQALYAKALKLFDLEEAKRVAAMKGQGYTLAEVKQHLQSLAQDA
jgi:hypothetical protein